MSAIYWVLMFALCLYCRFGILAGTGVGNVCWWGLSEVSHKLLLVPFLHLLLCYVSFWAPNTVLFWGVWLLRVEWYSPYTLWVLLYLQCYEINLWCLFQLCFAAFSRLIWLVLGSSGIFQVEKQVNLSRLRPHVVKMLHRPGCRLRQSEWNFSTGKYVVFIK